MGSYGFSGWINYTRLPQLQTSFQTFDEYEISIQICVTFIMKVRFDVSMGLPFFGFLLYEMPVVAKDSELLE